MVRRTPATSASTQNEEHAARHLSGLIPTHAGNTQPSKMRTFPHRAHPRAYGDNMKVSSFVVFFSGSSPRIRGTRWSELRYLSDGELTPAHTGNARRRIRRRG